MHLTKKKTVCIILCVILVSLVVIYHINATNNAYAEGESIGHNEGYDKGYAAGKREGYNEGYDKGYGFYRNIKDEHNFYHNHAVIVTETGKRYHRYNCYHIKNRSFYIYNTENARAKGYTPCLDCFD